MTSSLNCAFFFLFCMGFYFSYAKSGSGPGLATNPRKLDAKQSNALGVFGFGFYVSSKGSTKAIMLFRAACDESDYIILLFFDYFDSGFLIEAFLFLIFVVSIKSSAKSGSSTDPSFLFISNFDWPPLGLTILNSLRFAAAFTNPSWLHRFASFWMCSLVSSAPFERLFPEC